MLIIFFILGLLIGSFLNVVVFRLRENKSFVKGRSVCAKCGKIIQWFDNIPLISFAILGGKCRHCKEKISWQYPLVEFFTGLVFLLVGYFFYAAAGASQWSEVVFYLVFFSLLLVIFVYDFLHMEIPIDVIWMGVAVAVVYWTAVDWENFFRYMSFADFQLLRAALAGVLGFLFFYAFAKFSREKLMGHGDAYLGLMVGLGLGLRDTFLALMISFLIGGLYGIIVLSLKMKKMKSQIPYAPFLVIGALMAIFLPKMFPNILDIFFPLL